MRCVGLPCSVRVSPTPCCSLQRCMRRGRPAVQTPVSLRCDCWCQVQRPISPHSRDSPQYNPVQFANPSWLLCCSIAIGPVDVVGEAITSPPPDDRRHSESGQTEKRSDSDLKGVHYTIQFIKSHPPRRPLCGIAE